MLKAVREAKRHTSWIKPNSEYEDALKSFIAGLLGRMSANPFLTDFMAFQGRIASAGLLNSLAQLVLKLTVPGVPDIYQGNELWCFSLVDPDNRRPVDYGLRRKLLGEIGQIAATGGEQWESLIQAMLENLDDGRIKLYLTWRLLMLRKYRPALFLESDYTPLEVYGSMAEHLCAFVRCHEDEIMIVAVPRWFTELAEPPCRPVGEAVWQDTSIELPPSVVTRKVTNALTGEGVTVLESQGSARIMASDIFRSLPFAVVCHVAE
jgi:(1->4)-alpha-D-glucan 1-alpha-D-glucosylmutase